MIRSNTLALLCAAICLLGSGCYHQEPIPKAYFNQNVEMAVTVNKCPATAQMRDSGQGGLIGAMVTAGRASAMKEAMEGIVGDTVKELTRQKFEAAMEDYFDIYEDGQLQTVIDITQWGWYVPTTIAGIKTGAYQFILAGTVTVTDTQKKKKNKIGTCQITATESIGDKPTAAVSQEALLKCADKFATEAVAFLTKEYTTENE